MDNFHKLTYVQQIMSILNVQAENQILQKCEKLIADNFYLNQQMKKQCLQVKQLQENMASCENQQKQLECMNKSYRKQIEELQQKVYKTRDRFQRFAVQPVNQFRISPVLQKSLYGTKAIVENENLTFSNSEQTSSVNQSQLVGSVLTSSSNMSQSIKHLVELTCNQFTQTASFENTVAKENELARCLTEHAFNFIQRAPEAPVGVKVSSVYRFCKSWYETKSKIQSFGTEMEQLEEVVYRHKAKFNKSLSILQQKIADIEAKVISLLDFRREQEQQRLRMQRGLFCQDLQV